MKVLAIMGSPRRGKNNETLIDNMIKGIMSEDGNAEIEKYSAGDLALAPCIACDVCTKQRGCIKMDAGNDLITKFDKADIIILSSPIYFNSITAQLKAVIDRNQAIWSSKYILKDSLIDRSKKRIGFLICTGGAFDQPFGLEAVTPIMDIFFKSINAINKGNLFVTNVDQEPVWEKEEVLEKVYHIGKELVAFYHE